MVREYNRVWTGQPVLASCCYCPLYLASAKAICYLLLPVVTAVHDKRFPAETPRFCFLPRVLTGSRIMCTISAVSHFLWMKQELTESWRKLNHADSLDRKPFLQMVVLEGSKRSRSLDRRSPLWWTVPARSGNWQTSLYAVNTLTRLQRWAGSSLKPGHLHGPTKAYDVTTHLFKSKVDHKKYRYTAMLSHHF